ncbi:MAG: FIST N-terminal domain-containing protein [Campylobacterota bacterium]|nr:FIST N-terminal domain-containing protein [Campylobacterota bacterium]
MTTKTTYYKSDRDLIDFIENSKELHTDVLVQIFSGLLLVDLLEHISSLIKKSLPEAKIIGATTDGEINEKIVSTNKIVISISYFESTKLHLYHSEFDDSDVAINKKIPKSSKLLIMYACGFNTRISKILSAIKDEHKKLIISGGVAGDNGAFSESYIIHDSSVLKSGIVGVAFVSKTLSIYQKNLLSWKAIGVEFTITRSVDNIVYSINNKNPLELFNKFLGSEITANLPLLGTEFPLVINKDGYKIARVMLNKGSDGSLVFAGDMPQGSKVSFSVGSVDRILDSANILAEDIAQKNSETIFVYSCMARRHFLKNMAEYEFEHFSDNENISGFFTYGEFFTHKSRSDILNNSITLLALSENSKIDSRSSLNIERKLSSENSTVDTLLNITSATANELKLLNQNLEKKVQDSLAELEKKDLMIAQSARLAQMGEMISMIAHQWRQPLAAIASTVIDVEVKTTLKRFDLNSKSGAKNYEEFILSKTSEIDYMVKTLTRTIDDFRDFYKSDKRRGLVTIIEPIEKSFKIVQSLFESSLIEVKKDYQTQIEIYMYSSEMMQVVLNILKNSQDNFHERKILNPVINIGTYEDNEYVYIDISDNGGGVPDAIIDKVFDPYFSTKEEKNGTGLGLYMSRIIVNEHHLGKLKMRNIKGGVSTSIALKKEVRERKRV